MGSSRERLQLAADHKSLRAPGKSTLKLILLVMIWTTEADPCHPGLSDQPRASKHCKDKLNAVGIGERAILGFHAANRVPDGGSMCAPNLLGHATIEATGKLTFDSHGL
ncbi:hypothetical protein CPSG_01777 [Coccidioides posadasii str. Silveira]|uniref:Uncharacterized protein n=1 Tax=Coccidioides posadasii (strain RMSCC 757 / Silveira) TaxID=443226 RepID=E9CWE4_COCPS|nr:hypothetical protein CPSG_01777 [Coccidioides posadasii str. Silveira]